MTDSVINTLRRDIERFESDIDGWRRRIKEIDSKRRRENELWDRDIQSLEKQIETFESRRKEAMRQIERREDELARAAKTANDNNALGGKKVSGW